MLLKPSLERGTGAGRPKLAVIWVLGLYDLAEQVAKGKVIEPSRIILPPSNGKDAANLISWKPWRLSTTKLTPAKVFEFYRSGQPVQTASEYHEQVDSAPAEDGDGQLALEVNLAAPAETEADKKDENKKHNYTPWQWRTFANLHGAQPPSLIC